jgi:ABC-type proline/glycine betaine transport system permease subunit
MQGLKTVDAVISDRAHGIGKTRNEQYFPARAPEMGLRETVE